MDSLKTYVSSAREKGMSDARIKELAVDAGWAAHDVNAALLGSDEILPPRNTAATTKTAVPSSNQELTVVSGGFSVRGFEYLIYYITMGLSAFSIAALLHLVADELYGSRSIYQESQSFWVAMLIVTLPVFLTLMIRLRKAELKTPEIKKDSTRRRATQLMLLITFLVGIGRIIGFVFNIIGGGTSEDPITEELLHTLITVSTAGLIFFPLWLEDRGKNKADA